jgi:hypothetical protein
MALKYYADDKSCVPKAMSAFRAFETRFDSLDECCHAKFPLHISDCCEAGDCTLSGNVKFIPVSRFLYSMLLEVFITDIRANYPNHTAYTFVV